MQTAGRNTPLNSGACGRSTPLNAGACGRSTPLNSGACGGGDDDFEDNLPKKKPTNVNMFDESELESPIKNNFLLEHNRKINKPKLNNILNNQLEEEEKHGYDNHVEDDDDDEVAVAKMSNYLGSYSNSERK